MFREIKTREKITDAAVREEEHREYLDIKPETDMSIEEAIDFINDLFTF